MTERSLPVLALIVPCLDEEVVIEGTNSVLMLRMQEMMRKNIISDGSFILYVDDGSSDDTWKKIKKMASDSSLIKGIRLTANRGQQNALIAGMEYALGKCDVSITIDADLQDDPLILEDMIDSYLKGSEIVYGIRENRDTDTRFKRNTAGYFYRIMKRLGADCIYNHGDYRLMGSRAMEDLLNYDERNIFIRGLVPTLGYSQSEVYYSRGKRTGGKTKYPVRKMLEFAINGVTSFSVKPVRMLFWLGLLFMIAAMAIGIYTLIRYFTGETVEGWSSLILSIWFCTGILLMGMGIMGEYIGKIYIEVKHRPRYKIMEEI